jgi:hypothetical protein
MDYKIEPPEKHYSPSLPLADKGEAIELRSEEVHEILSRPPHALVRYGISVVCVKFVTVASVIIPVVIGNANWIVLSLLAIKSPLCLLF